MGREVRRVPKDWEHPRRPDGSYQPKHNRDYQTEADGWMADAILWAAKQHPDQKKDSAQDYRYYWEWAGMPPEEEYYMPAWSDKERTHWQMYEDTSEGTPISPVMETPEGLARWLADNNASSFADRTATYEQWLAMIHQGWAPSAVMSFDTAGHGEMKSGVEFIDEGK